MASLKDYERKRSRTQTPEPFAKGKRGKAPIFVVQRHDASRLHYDFRLERDGVLLSWAVPKGVPLEPGTQHLAVHVEDHPLTYATFEGEIPAGNYGAGTVEVWDKGTYELVEEKANGGMTVHLHGEKLNGPWTLVPAKLGGDPKNWLLVKKKTDEAPPRKAAGAYWPMLATPADAVPSGDGWLHEVKWDGYRAIVTIAGGVAELTSRRGNSLTARFESVARAVVQAVKTPDCVLDGEVCALDDAGPSQLLGDAAGVGAARPLRLRRARGRRRAARRAAARGTAPAARVAARQAQPDRPPLRPVRRRRSALRGGHGTAARGHRQQAGGLALRAWAPHPQLAQGEDARAAGARHRRLHEGPGAPLERLWRTRAGRQRGWRPALGRQRRYRLRRGGDRAAPRAS